jgi:hypothetical protein
MGKKVSVPTSTFNMVCIVVVAIAVVGLWEGVEAKALPAQGKSIQLTVSVA